MTDEELAAIRARAEAATPGPWLADMTEIWSDSREYFSWLPHDRPYLSEDHPYSHSDQGNLDTEFIAHARQDIPALLAEVERLQERERKLVSIVWAVAHGIHDILLPRKARLLLGE